MKFWKKTLSLFVVAMVFFGTPHVFAFADGAASDQATIDNMVAHAKGVTTQAPSQPDPDIPEIHVQQNELIQYHFYRYGFDHWDYNDAYTKELGADRPQNHVTYDNTYNGEQVYNVQTPDDFGMGYIGVNPVMNVDLYATNRNGKGLPPAIQKHPMINRTWVFQQSHGDGNDIARDPIGTTPYYTKSDSQGRLAIPYMCGRPRHSGDYVSVLAYEYNNRSHINYKNGQIRFTYRCQPTPGTLTDYASVNTAKTHGKDLNIETRTASQSMPGHNYALDVGVPEDGTELDLNLKFHDDSSVFKNGFVRSIKFELDDGSDYMSIKDPPDDGKYNIRLAEGINLSLNLKKPPEDDKVQNIIITDPWGYQLGVIHLHLFRQDNTIVAKSASGDHLADSQEKQDGQASDVNSKITTLDIPAFNDKKGHNLKLDINKMVRAPHDATLTVTRTRATSACDTITQSSQDITLDSTKAFKDYDVYNFFDREADELIFKDKNSGVEYARVRLNGSTAMSKIMADHQGSQASLTFGQCPAGSQKTRTPADFQIDGSHVYVNYEGIGKAILQAAQSQNPVDTTVTADKSQALEENQSYGTVFAHSGDATALTVSNKNDSSGQWSTEQQQKAGFDSSYVPYQLGSDGKFTITTNCKSVPKATSVDLYDSNQVFLTSIPVNCSNGSIFKSVSNADLNIVSSISGMLAGNTVTTPSGWRAVLDVTDTKKTSKRLDVTPSSPTDYFNVETPSVALNQDQHQGKVMVSCSKEGSSVGLNIVDHDSGVLVSHVDNMVCGPHQDLNLDRAEISGFNGLGSDGDSYGNTSTSIKGNELFMTTNTSDWPWLARAELKIKVYDTDHGPAVNRKMNVISSGSNFTFGDSQRTTDSNGEITIGLSCSNYQSNQGITIQDQASSKTLLNFPSVHCGI